MIIEHGFLQSTGDIGALVRRIRKRERLTQVKLARMLGDGITQRWISELERGLPKTLDGRYIAVLRKLGVELTYHVRVDVSHANDRTAQLRSQPSMHGDGLGSIR